MTLFGYVAMENDISKYRIESIQVIPTPKILEFHICKSKIKGNMMDSLNIYNHVILKFDE